MEFFRALVVDSNDRTRSVAASLIRERGFSCLEARDGIEALQLSSEVGIDLIFTEIDMPRMDGLELLKLVRRGVFGRNPPPVIIYTDEERLEELSMARLEDQCVAILAKPVSYERLEAAITKAMMVSAYLLPHEKDDTDI